MSAQRDTTSAQKCKKGKKVPVTSAEKASSTSGTRKHSISRSLQNFFNRNHSYSIRHAESNNNENNLFESINDVNELRKDSIPSRRSGKARVWSVRNSLSKSPVESISLESLQLSPSALASTKCKKRNKQSRVSGHAFDVLHSFKDLLFATEDNVDIDHHIKNPPGTSSNEKENIPTETAGSSSEDVGTGETVEDTTDGSGLSSFGCSVCRSNKSFCGHSACTSSCGSKDRCDCSSIAIDTDISTSYWNLQLPSRLPSGKYDHFSRKLDFDSRRYSLSTPSEHQATRTYLAKRSLSEQTALYRNKEDICWQDKLLNAMSHDCCTSKTKTKSQDLIRTETVRDDQFSDMKEKANVSIDIQRVHRIDAIKRSSSVCEGVRRSNSTCRSQLIDEDDVQGNGYFQRSRSSDDYSRSRFPHSRDFPPRVTRNKRHTLNSTFCDITGHYYSRERQISNSTCQSAFSDIESSEESESTQEPKESSSESRRQSSCFNDTSSLSACSVSRSSSNERNTTNINKININEKGDENKEPTVKGLTDGMFATENEKITDTENKDLADMSCIAFDDCNGVNGEAVQVDSLREPDKQLQNNLLENIRINELSAINDPIIEFCDLEAGGKTEAYEIGDGNLEIVTERILHEDYFEKEIGDGNRNTKGCNDIEKNELSYDKKECHSEHDVEQTYTDIGTDVDLFYAQTESKHDTMELCESKELNNDNKYEEELMCENNEVMLCYDYRELKDFIGDNVNTLETNKFNEEEDLINFDVDLCATVESPATDFIHNYKCEILALEKQEKQTDRNMEIIIHNKEVEEQEELTYDADIENILNYSDSVLQQDCESVAEFGNKKTEGQNTSDGDIIDVSTDTNDIVVKENCELEELECEVEFPDANTISRSTDDEMKLKESKVTDGEVEESYKWKVLEGDSKSLDIDTISRATDGERDDDCEKKVLEGEAETSNTDTVTGASGNDEVKENCARKELEGEVCYRHIGTVICLSNNQQSVCSVPENGTKSDRNIPVLEMMDESIQVEDNDVHNNSLEFHRVSIEEILFCSGKKGPSLETNLNDVDDVFEAINREVNKKEHKDKDMMILFLVGKNIFDQKHNY